MCLYMYVHAATKGHGPKRKSHGLRLPFLVQNSYLNTVEPLLTDTPEKADTHDITGNSKSPDCPSIRFNT